MLQFAYIVYECRMVLFSGPYSDVEYEAVGSCCTCCSSGTLPEQAALTWELSCLRKEIKDVAALSSASQALAQGSRWAVLSEGGATQAAKSAITKAGRAIQPTEKPQVLEQ